MNFFILPHIVQYEPTHRFSECEGMTRHPGNAGLSVPILIFYAPLANRPAVSCCSGAKIEGKLFPYESAKPGSFAHFIWLSNLFLGGRKLCP